MLKYINDARSHECKIHLRFCCDLVCLNWPMRGTLVVTILLLVGVEVKRQRTVKHQAFLLKLSTVTATMNVLTTE